MGKIIRRLPPSRTVLAIVFLFVQIGASLCLPYVTAQIIDRGVAAGNTAYIWTQGGFMICLSLVSLAGAALNTLLFSKISYGLGEQLRTDLYRKVLLFSKNEFDRFGASSLMTRNTNDVTQVQNLVEMSLKFLILAPIQMAGGILMTALLSPVLALVTVCTIPFLAVATAVIYRVASPLYEKMQVCLDRLNRFFKEGLTGVKVIRAFGKEQADFMKYRDANGAYAQTSITAGTIMSFFVPVITLLISVSTLVIVWLGGKAVAGGALQVGSIMGAISYSAQILMGFAMLTQVLLAVPRGQTSAKRIGEVLDTPLTIRDPEAAETMEETLSLTFEDVSFRYLGAEKPTLSGVSLNVHAGETLAIIGATGDGKTSLVNLISRLYDVESGTVRLNGADVRALPQDTLHNAISYAPQSSTLFFGTVRSNLLVGKPGATDEELWAALDMAQAGVFVRALENGLDGAVEKAGGNFSGGQKQRLCIARALLKDAAVYVFDDAFSALDYKTDAAVRAAMRVKTGKAITVIVAQRVSTITGADKIAVLDGGVLAGLGTHEALRAENPVYQQILESQTEHREVA